jgi:hypothetical protein
MPFRHEDLSAFGPEDLVILHEIFAVAWQKLRVDGIGGDDERIANAKRLLARCIMANAKTGKLDATMLLERCLGQFKEEYRRRGG